MTVQEFFEKLENGATWSAGVSFKRANPLPLDRYSVFKNLEDAKAYVKKPIAYPGQVIAVIDEVAGCGVYYIDSKMSLVEVGKTSAGDQKSIDIDENGLITLHGFKEASDGMLPQKQSDGSIKWVQVSEVVKGDGNTQTFGDSSSIDTVKAGDSDVYTAKLYGFDAASAGQAPRKKSDGKLEWVNSYSKEEVDSAIAAASHLKREVVPKLPELTEAKADVIYLVLKEPAGKEQNVYNEYLAIFNETGETCTGFELIGDTAVDLTDYAKTSEVTTAIQSATADLATKTEVTEATKDLATQAALAEVKATAEAAATNEAFEAYKTSNDTAVQGKLDTTALGSTITGLRETTPGLLSTKDKAKIDGIKDPLFSSVDSGDFQIVDGALKLQTIGLSKVDGLIDALEGKADAPKQGERFITSKEVETLQRVESGEFDNYVKSIDSHFTITEAGELQLTSISANLLTPTVGDLEQLIGHAEGNTIVNEINNLHEALTWQNIAE